MSRWGLDERLGGPLGRHAHPRGIFFDPAPWAVLCATVVWLLGIYRVTPCVQHEVTKPVDPYHRLCYSDIPVIYQTSGMGRGGSLLGTHGIEANPVVVAVMAACRWITGLFAEVGPKASDQQVLDAANTYWAVAQVVLFAAFLAVVIATMLLGRGSDAGLLGRVSDPRVDVDPSGRLVGGRRRSWDVFWVAASPLVFLAGIIDFSMVSVALAMLSALAWSRRRPVLAGVLVGLGCAANLEVAVLVFAVVIACLRTTQLRPLSHYLAAGVGVWALCEGLAAWANPSAWWHHLHSTFWSGTGLGSIWFLVNDSTGATIPGVGWITGALTVAGLLALTWLALTVPRRPRLAQLACLALLVIFVTHKEFSPQNVLLLVPLAALARPDWRDWTVLTVCEGLYQAAVWAHLGNMSIPGGTTSDVLYWAAILVRMAGEIWFAWGIVDDIRRPWNDTVRADYCDDPLGGVLDHAPDGRDEPDPEAPGHECAPMLGREPASGVGNPAEEQRR